MYKTKKNKKNNFACNSLIANAMLKRRRLVLESLSNITNTEVKLRRVK